MTFTCLLNLFFFTCIVTLSTQLRLGTDPDACTRCMNNRTCTPPDCFCCRNEFNLPISVKDIPQIVFFTFDDALTDSAMKFYKRLFAPSRKNPNGCPISMTLFVSHHDTVYTNVAQMYRKGMEIAAHSVSHAHMSNENFMKEAQNQKRNLATLGGVPENEIVGWRSPFLEPVGDMQPDTLKKLGYSYDATLTYSKRSLKENAPTPFTLDFGWPYDCKVKPCPKRRHFGFWEVPVVSLLDYLHKYDCVYVDGCNNPPPDENSAYNFLMDNFNSYYSRQRVPFGINMHPSWFYIPERLNAMDRFIQELSKKDDVFIVSVKKMIDWLKKPTGLSQIHNFESWQCNSHNQKSHSFGHRRQHVDAKTQRQNHIRSRLSKIHEMRKKYSSNRFQSSGHHDVHHNTPRPRWGKPLSMRPNTKPSPIAPWAHKNHDRPVKSNERISIGMAAQTANQSPVDEVPFWKRKPQTKQPAIRRRTEAAWWEKALPQTKTSKIELNSKPNAQQVMINKVKETTMQQVSKKPVTPTEIMQVSEPKRQVFRTTPVKIPKPLAEQSEKVQPIFMSNIANLPKTFVKQPETKRNVFRSPSVKTPLRFVKQTESNVNEGKKAPLKYTEQSTNEAVSVKSMVNNEKPTKSVTISNQNKVAPPKVDFKKQLKEQELKQLQMIENQRKVQEEQLRRQIEQLQKNNAEVLKRQQAEEEERMKEIERKQIEAMRMKEIERKQMEAMNQKKSINPKPEQTVSNVKEPAQKVIQTTVSETLEKTDKTTGAPENEEFAIFSNKKTKLDPWTRFVQFILKNKP